MMKNRLFEPASTYRHFNASPEHKHTPETELTDWRQQTRKLVKYSHHNMTQHLIEAAESNVTISIFYQGGSDSGRFRKFTPESVFRNEDSIITYVTGYCHLRRAHRVLRTDRISLG